MAGERRGAATDPSQTTAPMPEPTAPLGAAGAGLRHDVEPSSCCRHVERAPRRYRLAEYGLSSKDLRR